MWPVCTLSQAAPRRHDRPVNQSTAIAASTQETATDGLDQVPLPEPTDNLTDDRFHHSCRNSLLGCPPHNRTLAIRGTLAIPEQCYVFCDFFIHKKPNPKTNQKNQNKSRSFCRLCFSFFLFWSTFCRFLLNFVDFSYCFVSFFSEA